MIKESGVPWVDVVLLVNWTGLMMMATLCWELNGGNWSQACDLETYLPAQLSEWLVQT